MNRPRGSFCKRGGCDGEATGCAVSASQIIPKRSGARHSINQIGKWQIGKWQIGKWQIGKWQIGKWQIGKWQIGKWQIGKWQMGKRADATSWSLTSQAPRRGE